MVAPCVAWITTWSPSPDAAGKFVVSRVTAACESVFGRLRLVLKLLPAAALTPAAATRASSHSGHHPAAMLETPASQSGHGKNLRAATLRGRPSHPGSMLPAARLRVVGLRARPGVRPAGVPAGGPASGVHLQAYRTISLAAYALAPPGSLPSVVCVTADHRRRPGPAAGPPPGRPSVHDGPAAWPSTWSRSSGDHGRRPVRHDAPGAQGVGDGMGGRRLGGVPRGRRWPRCPGGGLPGTTLAVVLPIAVAALCLRAGGGTVFYVVMALYSLVAVSSRRAALAAAGLSAGAVLAGHPRRWRPAGGPGRHRRRRADRRSAGWPGRTRGPAGSTPRSRPSGRRRRRPPPTAERAEQVRRALADERAQIARELHDIVAHAMSVIAVRSGVARMVIDTDPAQAREALAIIETTTRRSLQEMRLLVGVLRDPETSPARPEPGPRPGRPRPPGRRHGRGRGHRRGGRRAATSAPCPRPPTCPPTASCRRP